MLVLSALSSMKESHSLVPRVMQLSVFEYCGRSCAGDPAVHGFHQQYDNITVNKNGLKVDVW
jgi:hypothetical protein